MPITHVVLQTAEQHPDRIAIAGEDGRLTYAELVEDSRHMFAAVESLHRAQPEPPAPAPETRGIPITAVSVESAFHTSRIVAGLAGYRAVSATLDPRWPIEHRVGVVLSTGIGVIVSDSADLAEALAARGWTGTVVSLQEFRELEGGAVPAPMPAVRGGEEPFLMLFSSGTTSNPKAFLKTREQYRANVAVSSAHLEPLPGVATLAPGPVSYSLTLYALIECMATGGSAHMADQFDAIDAGRRIAAVGITRVVAVPAVAQGLAAAARRDPERFASLELVVTGGANLPESIRTGLAEALPGVRLISYYGAAEIGFIGDSRDGDGTLISLYDGIEASIRDDAGNPVPDGELGTLWIRADACSDGYLAGTTTEVLRGADGWATVHDQGRLVLAEGGQSAAEAGPGTGGASTGGVASAEAGAAGSPAPRPRLQLVGRRGDIAVTGGHKVALPEVERAFDGMPGLGAVCAVALPDAALGTVVALVVEPESAAGVPGKAQLQEWAHARLAPQFVPRRWYAVDRLPRTVGQKIRRPATAELVQEGRARRL
ncbi:long-chain fatty acid--CoA ligase [Brevibacterium sp.]|uniref:class I adenylate-forming enzyme family protein n=1 Tax=Brevibacterium sp. TaxID=1701 RepID=UPI0025C5A6AD|nr:long-chain fatty acid--CoA ligase [Brevibacterium sp.]